MTEVLLRIYFFNIAVNIFLNLKWFFNKGFIVDFFNPSEGLAVS